MAHKIVVVAVDLPTDHDFVKAGIRPAGAHVRLCGRCGDLVMGKADRRRASFTHVGALAAAKALNGGSK